MRLFKVFVLLSILGILLTFNRFTSQFGNILRTPIEHIVTSIWIVVFAYLIIEWIIKKRNLKPDKCNKIILIIAAFLIGIIASLIVELNLTPFYTSKSNHILFDLIGILLGVIIIYLKEIIEKQSIYYNHI